MHSDGMHSLGPPLPPPSTHCLALCVRCHCVCCFIVPGMDCAFWCGCVCAAAHSVWSCHMGARCWGRPLLHCFLHIFPHSRIWCVRLCHHVPPHWMFLGLSYDSSVFICVYFVFLESNMNGACHRKRWSFSSMQLVPEMLGDHVIVTSRFSEVHNCWHPLIIKVSVYVLVQQLHHVGIVYIWLEIWQLFCNLRFCYSVHVVLTQKHQSVRSVFTADGNMQQCFVIQHVELCWYGTETVIGTAALISCDRGRVTTAPKKMTNCHISVLLSLELLSKLGSELSFLF